MPAMPMRYVHHDAATNDARVERFEPRGARTDFFFDGRGRAHVAKTDLNRFCRHGRALPPFASADFVPVVHLRVVERLHDDPVVHVGDAGAFDAARSADSRCSHVPTVPVSVAVSPDTVTVM